MPLTSERRLLVLGGTAGIGAEFAALARESLSKVLVCGDEDFDIRDHWQLRRHIDIFDPTDAVYSVGVNELDWIKDLERDSFSDLMDINVWGFLSTIQELQRTVGAKNVVAVTSDAAWRPMRTSAAYCASKAALEMAVRVASRELAPAGWRINAVAPGKVEDTAMTSYVDERVLELRGWTVEAAEAYEVASTPLGRKVTKREVAEVIWSVLNGPKAQTGEIIAVNGGR